MWRSSKAEIVIVDVLDAWQRFDDANHRQVGQSKQVLPLREMNNLEIDVKKLSWDKLHYVRLHYVRLVSVYHLK